jgi:hypothetical protein
LPTQSSVLITRYLIFPRPPRDNGIGMHLGFDLSASMLKRYVPALAQIRATWCLIPHRGTDDLGRAAYAVATRGILPVARWLCTIDENVIDFVRHARVLRGMNLPAYIQIFNEPSNPHEWRDGVPKPRAFTARWCEHAARVVAEEGFPGLQVLHVEELEALLRELKLLNAQSVIERMWFCPHPYGANHPPAYPYDELNQRDHPGATLNDDPDTVLQFLEFAPVFERELGFVPPFIAGECGWQYGNAFDPRYPKIDDTHHALYHAALFEMTRTNKLPNGAPLPDFVYAFCPWILYGAEADAWFSSTTGVRQQTLDAVTAIPPFLRRETFAPPSSPEAATRRPVLAPLPAPLRPPIRHYLLFGSHRSSQWHQLILTRNYITRYKLAFGFSLKDAIHAQRVTIVGDTSQVSLEEEAQLKRAGVRVERWLGDLSALEIILEDRLARNVEFGG